MRNDLTILLCSLSLTIYGQHLDVEGDARIVGKLNITHSILDSSVYIGANAGIHARDDVNRYNTVVGALSGNLTTTGVRNSFFGYGAGESNTVGAENTLMGYSAGRMNTTGDANTYFGTASGFANGFGSNNAFFGYGTGYLNSASNNAFFGSFAGRYNAEGTANAFFGRFAGLLNNQGNQNTFIGNNAGKNNTNGSYNTALGSQSDFISDSLRLAISIGYKAQVNCSNCAVIGGIGKDAVKVGIGTSTPDRELTIEDNDADAVIKIKTTATPMNELILGVNASSGGWMRTVTDTDLSLWTNSLKRLTIRNTGEVQIHKLGIAGNQQLCLNASGELAPCSSSRRYKEHIVDYNSSQDLITDFRPVTYDWKDSGHADIGLVAEEVALIDPRLVTYNDAGQVEGVKYDRLGVLLLDVVKQQQNEINLLKEAFQELKMNGN